MQADEMKRAKKNRRRRIFFSSLMAFLILFVASWFILDRWAKKHGFTGAGQFVKTVVVNYWSSLDAEYQTIEITIDENDFLKLEKQREEHLKNGIITKTDDRYVRAIITHKGKKVKCKLRLKGHMTDHLQDKKWSFRVKTVSGDAFEGMKIFSLMHPGTRNYIYEWIFHKMLAEEGIATVRYSFLNVKVNGESWGIYALEENFAEELIGHHGLPDGPILGFNPDLYWYARLNEHQRKKVDMEDIQGFSAAPEAYDEKENFKDQESKSDYAEAIIKLEKFKRGELTTSQVFDIEKLARFHAILDLVGGQFSLDWSDVKYYYNPITQKIEPVGYESFSVRNTSFLCGTGKFRNNAEEGSGLHERIFSDPSFFARYIHHLKRISARKYLDDFFDEYDSDIKNNLAVLYTEFPYKRLPLTQYYTNQDNIRTLLNTPITTMVYLERNTGDSLFFTVGNSSVLPVELEEIEINGKWQELDSSVFFTSRRKNENVFYETIVIPSGDTAYGKIEDIRLKVHYPGEKKITVLEVKPIPLDPGFSFDDFVNDKPNHEKFDFIESDESLKEIRFKEGEFILKEKMIIPAGYKVKNSGNLKLHLENQAAIITKSPIEFKGSEESPIEIVSDDSSGIGFIFLDCKETSFLKWVGFSNINVKSAKKDTYKSILTFYQSAVEISHCEFYSKGKQAISVYKAKVVLRESGFSAFTGTAVKAHYAKLVMKDLKFLHCDGTINWDGSEGTITGLNISKSKSGVNLENGSSLKGMNWKISDTGTGVEANDLSELKLETVSLDNIDVGFRAEKKSDVFGPAEITVKGLKKSKVKEIALTDKKSKIVIE